MKLQGRVAVVTGASRGIGKAVAQTLAREGAAVGVNYIKNAAEANRVVAEIRAGGGIAVDESSFVTGQVIVADGGRRDFLSHA